MSRNRIALTSIIGAGLLAIGATVGAFAQDGGHLPPPPPAGHAPGEHGPGPWGHGPDDHGPGEHGPWSHIDGRIAYIRAELKITPQQETAFKAFEAALRQQAEAGRQLAEKRHAEFEKHRAEVEKKSGPGGGEPPHPTLTEILSHEQEALTQHAKFLSDYRAAVEPLYAVLTAEQKAKADMLLPPHHGGFEHHGGFGR